MHYYEDDRDEIEQGYSKYMHGPVIRVDHANRCAVMLCLDRKLVVLPFVSTTAETSSLGLHDTLFRRILISIR